MNSKSTSIIKLLFYKEQWNYLNAVLAMEGWYEERVSYLGFFLNIGIMTLNARDGLKE